MKTIQKRDQVQGLQAFVLRFLGEELSEAECDDLLRLAGHGAFASGDLPQLIRLLRVRH